MVLFRVPEAARGRHQAVEERRSHGIWPGHARDTGDTLVSRDSGVRKGWAIRRLPEYQLWDGERPTTIWNFDAGPEKDLIERR